MGEQVFCGQFLRKGVDGGRASRVLSRVNASSPIHFSLSLSPPPSLSFSIHTYTYMYIHTYIYVWASRCSVAHSCAKASTAATPAAS